MERNRFPVAPAILGVVLGGMLEENFVSAMIESEGKLVSFFDRPIAGTLGVLTLLLWMSPLALRWLRQRRSKQA
jgi:TctA family transporter